MPAALIIALLANAEPIVTAIEDIIAQIKAKGGTHEEIDAVVKDVVTIITDAIKAYDGVGKH